jgi:hypothetical protein
VVAIYLKVLIAAVKLKADNYYYIDLKLPQNFVHLIKFYNFWYLKVNDINGLGDKIFFYYLISIA